MGGETEFTIPRSCGRGGLRHGGAGGLRHRGALKLPTLGAAPILRIASLRGYDPVGKANQDVSVTIYGNGQQGRVVWDDGAERGTHVVNNFY
jgi:hypothetical protein